jgi:hypothetical protein
MELTVVGYYTVGVGETAAWVENHLGNRIGAALARVRTDSSLKAIVFFPTITDPKIIQKPDNISYRRSDPAVYLSVNIPYEAWMEGGRLERAGLFAAALCKGIDSIKESKLSSDERDSLVGAVKDAYQNLKSEFS